MANFTTVSDLCDDALFMAGESIGADASAWYDRAPTLLSAVMTALTAGTPLADRYLDHVDWWWARSSLRGIVKLEHAVNVNGAEAITLTNGSDQVTFDTGQLPSSGWDPRSNNSWLLLGHTRDTIPFISALNNGRPFVPSSGTMDAAWGHDTVTTSNWITYKRDIALPSNFGRFVGSLSCGRPPYIIQVVDANTLEEMFPAARRESAGLGCPSHACLQDEVTLQFSHYIEGNFMDVEFEYIPDASQLTRGGTDPVIPQHHRRILSYGAAYLIMWEKRDKNRGEAFGLFSGAWEGMANEQYKQTMGSAYGQITARPGQVGGGRRRLVTESGIIIG